MGVGESYEWLEITTPSAETVSVLALKPEILPEDAPNVSKELLFTLDSLANARAWAMIELMGRASIDPSDVATSLGRTFEIHSRGWELKLQGILTSRFRGDANRQRDQDIRKLTDERDALKLQLETEKKSFETELTLLRETFAIIKEQRNPPIAPIAAAQPSIIQPAAPMIAVGPAPRRRRYLSDAYEDELADELPPRIPRRRYLYE